MNTPTSQQVLRLYKHLIKYGNQLKLTDQSYYLKRIRKEFKECKTLTSPVEITFNFEVNQ